MSNFKINVVSYLDREEPVAEICHNHIQWAEISPKNGKLITQFYSHPRNEYWEFLLEDAIEALNNAKNRLLKTLNTGFQFGADSEQISKQGLKILEGILNDPDRSAHQQLNGSLKIYSSDGRGAYFHADGSFRGFIEEYHE